MSYLKGSVLYKSLTVTIVGLVFLLASVSVAVSVGAVAIPISSVWGILAAKLMPNLVEHTWSQGREAIVWEIRFPRALLAVIVGAGLAMVGATLQAVTRNPLADPHLLGCLLYTSDAADE